MFCLPSARPPCIFFARPSCIVLLGHLTFFCLPSARPS
jgi:hypothetical protein